MKFISILPFILIVATILIFTYLYVGYRFINFFNISSKLNTAIWIGILILVLFPIISSILKMSGLSGYIPDVMSWVGFVFWGFISLLLILMVIRDSGILLYNGFNKISTKTISKNEVQVSSENNIDLDKRNSLKLASNLFILFLASSATGYGIYNILKFPSLKKVKIKSDKLNGIKKPLRITQFSDLHVGSTIGKEYVEKVVELINGTDPDIVVFTGDLADGSVAELRDKCLPLKQLKSRFGSYFVTGNHEYYSGIEDWEPFIKNELDFTILNNEHEAINFDDNVSIVLAGVPDFRANRVYPKHNSDPSKAIEGISDDKLLKILLAHQPKSVFAAAKAGYDIQLSGHTHGGQYFPLNKLVKLDQPYNIGLHKHDDNLQIYVNSGTGYWGPPLRIGTESEISVIEIS